MPKRSERENHNTRVGLLRQMERLDSDYGDSLLNPKLA